MNRLQDIQTFQKPGITGNQQGSEKQKYSAPNSTQFHPSQVISVGKVTVENIVNNCEKNVASATGKTILQQCVNSSYSCKWPDRKWDSQNEQRGYFFIKPFSSENHTDEVYVNLKINHTLVKFQLVTGSQVNVITEKNLQENTVGKITCEHYCKTYQLFGGFYTCCRKICTVIQR